MRRIDDDHYRAELNVPIPLLRGLYEADIVATEQQRPERCHLALTSSTRFGLVRATGWLRFSSDGATTVVSFDGDVELGRLAGGSGAGIAGRVVATPARALLDRFFVCLAASLGSGDASS